MLAQACQQLNPTLSPAHPQCGDHPRVAAELDADYHDGCQWEILYVALVNLGLYSVAMYGGLILFGAFLLYDTQKIIHKAERHPQLGYGAPAYDPINASMSIYMDTINIFIRIAQLLAGGRRK